jgi:hypothetical protein
MDQGLLRAGGRRIGGEIFYPSTLEVFMKRFATLFVALGLATAGSTVLAEEAKDQVSKQVAKPQPMQMTDAQLDNVAGGALVFVGPDLIDLDVTVRDVAQGIQVAVPVTAAVGNVGVLTGPQLADVMAAQRGVSGTVGRIR